MEILTKKLDILATKSNSTKRQVGCLIEMVMVDGETFEFEGYNQSIIDLHNYQCDIKVHVHGKDKIINNPYTVHAEHIAIERLKGFLIQQLINVEDIKSITISVNWAPCLNCSREIILLKLKTLADKANKIEFKVQYINAKYTFLHKHKDTNSYELIPKNVLESCDIKVEQIK